jgi:hypothetical protein
MDLTSQASLDPVAWVANPRNEGTLAQFSKPPAFLERSPLLAHTLPLSFLVYLFQPLSYGTLLHDNLSQFTLDFIG